MNAAHPNSNASTPFSTVSTPRGTVGGGLPPPLPVRDIHRIVSAYGKNTAPKDPPGHMEKKCYTFEVSREIVEELEAEGLCLEKVVHTALSAGLRLLEEKIGGCTPEPYEAHRYDERRGCNRVWMGSTKHHMEPTPVPLSQKMFGRMTRLITTATKMELDHRQVYWTLLVKPYAPKGMGQQCKETLQSNQLPKHSTTLLLYACLYSHLLKSRNRPIGQKKLGVE